MNTEKTLLENENQPSCLGDVMCSVGDKCQQNFGEGRGSILRICTVTAVKERTFDVIADGLGWKMSNIPLDKFRKHCT
jgi:hypothetical protein